MRHVFRDSEFLSAREKWLVLRHWVRFLKHGLRFADFTRRLYEHLHLHCSFIAHYDRAGFYATYFERGEDAMRFLSQFDQRGEGRSVEYGGTWWLSGEYADLNQAMVVSSSINALLCWLLDLLRVTAQLLAALNLKALAKLEAIGLVVLECAAESLAQVLDVHVRTIRAPGHIHGAEACPGIHDVTLFEFRGGGHVVVVSEATITTPYQDPVRPTADAVVVVLPTPHDVCHFPLLDGIDS